jgi:hypothetical protein
VSRAFVVDASVGFSWVHPGQASVYTDAVLATLGEGASVYVPTLWPIEICNAILVAIRRRRMTNAEGKSAFEFLKCLTLTVDSDAPSFAFGRICELAQAHVSWRKRTRFQLTMRATWNWRFENRLPLRHAMNL